MKNIKLTQEAYGSSGNYGIRDKNGKVVYYLNSWYEAAAVDEDGNDYTVVWEICDTWDGNDEASACDWDKPIMVIDYNDSMKNIVDNVVIAF